MIRKSLAVCLFFASLSIASTAQTTVFSFPPSGTAQCGSIGTSTCPCVFETQTQPNNEETTLRNPLVNHGGVLGISNNLLFGTTAGDVGFIGSGTACNTSGTEQPGARGAIFYLDPNTSNFVVLATMPTGTTVMDNPTGHIVFDTLNNMYGTSFGSGLIGEKNGSVWKLAYTTSTHSYASTPTIVYTFDDGNHGRNPVGGLFIDGANNLYGTTWSGGTSENGVLFVLKRSGSNYTTPPTILHIFSGGSSDGATPESQLTDSAFVDQNSGFQGHLYGTTRNGGGSANCTNGCGTVFEEQLTIAGDAAGYFNLLNFAGGADSPDNPLGAVQFTQSGLEFLGTSNGGGSNTTGGNIFLVTQSATGSSNTLGVEINSTAFQFTCSTTQICRPRGAPYADVNGNLYLIMTAGGTNSVGGVELLTLQTSGTTQGSYSASTLATFAGGTGVGSASTDLSAFGTTLYGTAMGGSNTCDGHSCGVIWSLVE